jgi:hypothetical protein
MWVPILIFWNHGWFSRLVFWFWYCWGSTKVFNEQTTKLCLPNIWMVIPFLPGRESSCRSDDTVRYWNKHLVSDVLWHSSSSCDGRLVCFRRANHLDHLGWTLQQWNRPSHGTLPTACFAHHFCSSSMHVSGGILTSVYCFCVEVLTDNEGNTGCSHHCVNDSDDTWFQRALAQCT